MLTHGGGQPARRCSAGIPTGGVIEGGVLATEGPSMWTRPQSWRVAPAGGAPSLQLARAISPENPRAVPPRGLLQTTVAAHRERIRSQTAVARELLPLTERGSEIGCPCSRDGEVFGVREGSFAIAHSADC